MLRQPDHSDDADHRVWTWLAGWVGRRLGFVFWRLLDLRRGPVEGLGLKLVQSWPGRLGQPNTYAAHRYRAAGLARKSAESTLSSGCALADRVTREPHTPVSFATSAAKSENVFQRDAVAIALTRYAVSGRFSFFHSSHGSTCCGSFSFNARLLMQ
jgi:hypothetical protein